MEEDSESNEEELVDEVPQVVSHKDAMDSRIVTAVFICNRSGRV